MSDANYTHRNGEHEVPVSNGDYRMDDDRGTVRVEVRDGVVMDMGWTLPKGTITPQWMLDHYHARFYGPLEPIVNTLAKSSPS